MTHKVYHSEKEKLVENSKTDFEDLVEEFYRRVGEKWQIQWVKRNNHYTPKIKKDDLPENISMKEVEKVLNSMKNDGWF